MRNPFRPGTPVNRPVLLITAVSIFAGIALPAYLDHMSDDPYLIASFGATAVLIYGAPKAPFSKPKNVFFGHLFSALIGVAIGWTFFSLGLYDDFKWVAAALAVTAAICTMILTDTVHPPGGATALACVMSGFFGLEFVVRPFMLGICYMMLVAYAANRFKARYE